MYTSFLFLLFVAASMFVGMEMVALVPDEPMVTGGLTPADVNDETIQLMAGTAVQGLGSEYGLSSITSAHTQVVAGSLYHMTLEVTKTSAGNSEPKQLTCKVKVLEQTWTGVLELTHYCCDLHITFE